MDPFHNTFACFKSILANFSVLDFSKIFETVVSNPELQYKNIAHSIAQGICNCIY